MLTEYHTHEMVTLIERTIRNALKFGATGDVNSQEAIAFCKRNPIPPRKGREDLTPQDIINGAVGEARIRQPQLQRRRLATKLRFDVDINDPGLDIKLVALGGATINLVTIGGAPVI